MIPYERPVEQLAKAGLMPSPAAHQAAETCATCGKPVMGFRNRISEKEYHISAMCQVCQDSVFGID